MKASSKRDVNTSKTAAIVWASFSYRYTITGRTLTTAYHFFVNATQRYAPTLHVRTVSLSITIIILLFLISHFLHGHYHYFTQLIIIGKTPQKGAIEYCSKSQNITLELPVQFKNKPDITNKLKLMLHILDAVMLPVKPEMDTLIIIIVSNSGA